MENFKTQHLKRINLPQLAVFMLFMVMVSIIQIASVQDTVDAESAEYVGPTAIITVRNKPVVIVEEENSSNEDYLISDITLSDLKSISDFEFYSKKANVKVAMLSMQQSKNPCQSPFDALINESTKLYEKIKELEKESPLIEEEEKDETETNAEEVTESASTNYSEPVQEDIVYEEPYYEEVYYYEPEPEPAPPAVVISPYEDYNNELLQELTPEQNEAVRLIAYAIDRESGGTLEDDYGVASVVVNRMHHELFGGVNATALDILTAPYQYPWGDSDPSIANLCGSDESLKVAYDVYINGNNIFPPNVVFQAQFYQGNGIYTVIGVHYYCYL